MHCNGAAGRQENKILRMAGEKRENFHKRNHRSTADARGQWDLIFKAFQEMHCQIKILAPSQLLFESKNKVKGL